MVDSCCAKICKYTLFIFNFLVFLAGCGLLGFGIWAKIDKDSLDFLKKVLHSNQDVPGLLESAAIVLIVVGAVLLLLGFMGCWGACREVKCLLVTYAIFLGLIFVLEIVAGVLAVVFKSKIDDELKKELFKQLKNDYDGKHNSSKPFSVAMDYSQVKYECCGIDNYTDFQNHADNWIHASFIVVPDSCCKLKNKDDYFDNTKFLLEFSSCPGTPTSTNSHMDKACYEEIKSHFEKYIWYVVGIAFGIAALELLGIIFAACLVCAIRDEAKVV